MRKIIALLVILVVACPVNFGQDIFRVIPEGWQLANQNNGKLAIAKGDLNKDGIQDVALVIEEATANDAGLDRHLIIAFGNEEGSYRLSTQAEKAILHKISMCI